MRPPSSSHTCAWRRPTQALKGAHAAALEEAARAGAELATAAEGLRASAAELEAAAGLARRLDQVGHAGTPTCRPCRTYEAWKA